MAPKRSRTVDSSNTIPTSDSSRGTAAKPRLVDRDAEEEYARLLTKLILKERGFLPSGRDGELLPMIAEKGWIYFCKSPEAVPMSVVREFYANAKVFMRTPRLTRMGIRLFVGLQLITRPRQFAVLLGSDKGSLRRRIGMRRPSRILIWI